MTGCTDSKLPVITRELDETIDSLVPAVEDLLQRLTDSVSVLSEVQETEVKLTAPLQFPDGIGQGQIVARLFRWREAARIDIEIVHDRAFSRPDGSASDRKCFLNDYEASISLPAGTKSLPGDFERQVISGVSAARDAVQRHNRGHCAPWNRVSVTAM